MINHRKYFTNNSCRDFLCEKNILVHKTINSECLPLDSFLKKILIDNESIIWITEICFLTITGIIWFYKCTKKVNTGAGEANKRPYKIMESLQDRVMDTSYQKKYYGYCARLVVQGSNKPDDPWYLELNFSKEFENEL